MRTPGTARDCLGPRDHPGPIGPTQDHEGRLAVPGPEGGPGSEKKN